MTTLTLSPRARTGRDVVVGALIVAFTAIVLLNVAQVASAAYLAGLVNSAAAIGVLAAGATLCVAARTFDVSVAATVGVSATVAAVVSNLAGGALGVLAAALTGLCLGLVTGALVSRWHAPALLVTLAAAVVYQSVATLAFTGTPVTLTAAPLAFLRSLKAPTFPSPAGLLMVVALTGLGVVLWRTALGRRIVAVGGNREAARLGGIRVHRVEVAVCTVNGLCAGVAGALVVADAGVASPSLGTPWVIAALAALAIGGNSLLGGVASMWRTALGVVVVTLCSAACTALSWAPESTTLTIATLALVALGLEGRRR